jgi:histidinol-phosphate aminotransferase
MADITRRTWIESAALALAAGTSAHAAVPHSGPYVRLSLNENPFGPSPLAITAIRGELSSLDRYTADRGDALEAQIAALEGVSPDQVILGEILDELGLQLALAGPRGGEFVYSVPGYTALVDAVSPGGGTVVGVPLNDRQENDLPAIAAKLNTRTRAVYVVNPHNPSGTVSDRQAFLDFVRETAKRSLVIVDEAYLEFLPDFPARTAASLTREGANVIVFRTFGKIYGLAGLSIGYAIAPKALAAALKAKGLGSTLELNRLSVAAASASLRDHGYLPRMRTLVTSERDQWNALFATSKLRHADSKGNFVFFETGRPHGEFAAALRSKGVDIGRAFAPLDKWARISIGLPAENALARAAVAQVLR